MSDQRPQNYVRRMKRMPARVYQTRRILHFFIGHVPVFMHDEETTENTKGEKRYRCYWCAATLRRGMWEFLYDDDGKADQ